MTARPGGSSPDSFGGSWTSQKLAIVEEYLGIYTTALKKQPWWKLLYIDAFAGTGKILDPRDLDGRSFLAGSAERALGIRDRPFDELIFVETDPQKCETLRILTKQNPRRRTRVVNQDANEFLRGIQRDWRKWRGVLFLDPFGAQVEWQTIETVASFEALDAWILFPTTAIQRMLPRTKNPDDIEEGWVKRLNLVYGGEDWRGLYRPSPQRSLFGDTTPYRDPGADGLLKIYKEKLALRFGDRLLRESKPLYNSTGTVLFELLFLVGNPAGIDVAKRIAAYSLGATRHVSRI